MKTRGDFLKKTAIPKKTLYLWQFRVFLIGGLLCLLCLDYRKNLHFLNIVAVVLAVLALFIIVWYLPKFFNGYEIVFKGDAVIINYGVFIKFTHIMPYSRLIYAQSFATPLARVLKITAITLKAARGWVVLPELQNNDAFNIINSLSGEKYNA